jgi:hypothetical protein
MAQCPKNESGTLGTVCDYQVDGGSVKESLCEHFPPVLAAIIFPKLLFLWFPLMSVNSLGWVAKGCAYPRTSPDFRPSGAPDTAVWRYPAPLFLHPYYRFTYDRALHLHVQSLVRVRV